MNLPGPDPTLHTLEPLLDAVRDGVEHAGWVLSGLQKTTSQEFDGRWAGESTRSAYLFFHRGDLPESVGVEGFLDETSQGLRGNLSLVVDGPALGALGEVSGILERARLAVGETFPAGYRSPLAVRVSLPDADRFPEDAKVQLRVKLLLPTGSLQAGASDVSALATAAVEAFERLLERPEIAELLPPVVD